MLAMVGSGEYLDEVDIIDTTLIGRLSAPARVVCLPTAAGTEGDAMVDSWLQKGVTHFSRLGAVATGVRIIDRATATDPTLASQIAAANFVYLSGGNPNYLANTLEDSPAWAAIMSVHQQGGVVAGCSAGAMIMGERIAGPMGSRPGFNLVPGVVIMPHFDEFPGIVQRIMRLLSGRSLTMIGVDGRTALVKTEHGYEILGKGQVTVIKKSGTMRFNQGPLPAGLLHDA